VEPVPSATGKEISSASLVQQVKALLAMVEGQAALEQTTARAVEAKPEIAALTQETEATAAKAEEAKDMGAVPPAQSQSSEN
jgi:hypothetical protein